MPMKRDTGMATHRQRLALAIPSTCECDARPVSALPTLARAELVSLLQRLQDEVEALLDDLAPRREASRNRESSRQ
jgi:hypothetical protein